MMIQKTLPAYNRTRTRDFRPAGVYTSCVMGVIEQETSFISHGLLCGARLYLPEGGKRPPVVVMAHGIAAEMAFRLPPFARVFAEAGIAAFVFDYRNFGESEGEPRNLVSPRRHLQDWRAATDHVRSLGSVDGSRMALWGSSFSGGHVLVTAAKTPGLKAVVSQVPFVDGIASARLVDRSKLLAGTVLALRDVARAAMHKSPVTVPVVGDPGELALMAAPDSKPGYLSLVPEDSDWKNEAPARVVLQIPAYRPVRYASRIDCPVLLLVAEKDTLIPPSAVKGTADMIREVELASLPVGHFDVYDGEDFEKVVSIEKEFLLRHLC